MKLRTHRQPSDTAADREYDETRHDEVYHDRAVVRDAEARDRFGGTNLGAAFFGWLVAVAMAILLMGIVGAIASGAGAAGNLTPTDAQREAGTVGVVAAAVLVGIMLLAYYAGGYVAGRMSRYDGARQGLVVWIIGLLVTAVAVGVGLLFGTQYNVLDRVDMPRIPIPTDQLGMAGIITALAIVVGTALTAMAGGKVGHRYHNKVDRAAFE